MMWINSYGLIAHVAVEKELKRVLIRQNVTYWLIEGADLKTCSPVSKLCWPPLCWCQPTDARSSLRSSREKELHVNQAWLMRSLGDQGESRREVLQDGGWWAEGVLGDEWAGSGRQNLADMPDSDPVPWAARSSLCFIKKLFYCFCIIDYEKQAGEQYSEETGLRSVFPKNALKIYLRRCPTNVQNIQWNFKMLLQYYIHLSKRLTIFTIHNQAVGKWLIQGLQNFIFCHIKSEDEL